MPASAARSPWRERLRAARWLEIAFVATALVLTSTYFWLMDDAFVYFRYVDNLLFLGRGLVYNEGEYVEGYTSPLWVLLLVPLRALELDYYTLVRGLSLVACGLLAWLLIRVSRALSPAAALAPFSLALFAAHYGMLSHLSSGLETPLVLLAAGLCALAAVQPGSRAVQLLMGLLPLARPELLLPALLFFVYATVERRRMPWLFVASLGLANGGWLLFRIYYYAALLPNTYYLKDLSNPAQGFAYLVNALGGHELLLLAALGTLLSPHVRAHLRSTWRPRAFMLACALSVAVWVVRVGGDMIYFRFLVFPFTLALCALSGLPEAALARLPAPRRTWIEGGLLVGVFLASLAIYPAQLEGHPLTFPASGQASGIEDPMFHRLHPSLHYTANRAKEDQKQLSRYRKATEQMRRHDVMSREPWCRSAYDRWNDYIMHSYGLTNPILARIDIAPVRPGHKRMLKWTKYIQKALSAGAVDRGRGALAKYALVAPPPDWVIQNRDALERLERQMYNHHDFAENLGLALHPVGWISVGER